MTIARRPGAAKIAVCIAVLSLAGAAACTSNAGTTVSSTTVSSTSALTAAPVTTTATVIATTGTAQLVETGSAAATSATPSSSRGTASTADTLPPPIRPGIEIPPGRVDAAVAQLDGLASSIMTKSGVPGMAVAVVYQGKVLYAKGFGVRKVGDPAPVDANTVFQLASVSKAIGATVVAHEITLGKVDWNTPVHANLPSLRFADPYVSGHVTIGDMYAHRSGLPPHAGDLLEDLGYSQQQIFDRLRHLSLNPFRSTYAYTNFGMTTAAESVARAAGTDWATLSDEAVYKPLGMTSTSSRFADYVARANRAWTHVKSDGKWQTKYVRDPDQQSPAGGVSSSVKDLAEWMIMVLNDGTGSSGQKIASAEALTPAVTPEIVSSPAQVPPARAGFYGYGFDVTTQASGRVQISHSGAFSAGAGTNFVLSPLAGFGIVTLTNGTPVGAAEALNQQFNDLVVYGHPDFDWWTIYSQALGGLASPFGELAGKTPPVKPAPAAAARTYVGKYHNNYVGDAEVTSSGGGLALVLGPKRMTFLLRHWDGDVFTYAPSGESANPGSVSKVTFTRGSGGTAARMVIEYYQQDGQGTFTR